MIKGQRKLKLGRKATHTKALVRNLLRSLFTNGYLTTTTIKAKALRQEALKLLNDVKSPTPLVLKRISVRIGSRELVEKIVKYLSTNEGQVKVLKIGYRDGDKAQTSRVTLVGYNTKKEAVKVEKKDKKDEKVVEVKKTSRLGEVVKNVGKSVRNAAAPRTERARSRSGL